ncbi:MAG: MarR family winged helix-turn-helix transcriptional regulator [bacterium]
MSIFDPRERAVSRSSRSTISLYRVSQAMGHMLRGRAQARGLSPAQLRALLFLRYARPGLHTIGGLAERLAVSYATASGVVDALERKALVERHADAADQRVTRLALTETGRAEVAAVENVLDGIEETIAALPAAEQQALERGLQAIVGRLQAQGHVQVYEMCWGCHFFRENAHPENTAGPHHCAFVDAPLPEPNTYLECPDFVPRGAIES